MQAVRGKSHLIGYLKGRMRQLREVPLHTPSEVGELIMAGCILHNLCIIDDDDIDKYVDLNNNQRPLHSNRHPNIFPNAREGVQRRLILMNEMDLA
jgi:hypothetical protein